MSKRLKELVTKELTETYKDTKNCVLVEYRGLNAQQMDSVRKAFALRKARMKVVNNAMAAIALEKVGMGALKPYLQGPIAIVSDGEDPAALAKTVQECTKGLEGFKVRGGFGDGQVFTSEQVKALASIPPREVLYARMLGLIQGPMAALASAFGGIQRSLACALQAIKEKKEKESPPPAAEAAPPAAEKPAEEAKPAEPKPAEPPKPQLP